LKVTDALAGLASVFLDTSPVIYYVQGDQRYLNVIKVIFDQIDASTLMSVTSPVTLAECLVLPYRTNQVGVQQAFINQVVGGNSTIFTEIDQQIAERAAELRARHNIGLLDALQFAVALKANCDAFVTNDTILKRVTEIKVIVVDDLEI